MFGQRIEEKDEKICENPISNVMEEKDVRIRIKKVLNKIYNIVGSTSGPFGKNVIVQDNMLSHYTTKDGYTVMKNIVFKEHFDRTIGDFIKKVSSRLNSTVGDGTTSAVLISTKLYEKLLDYANKNKVSFRDIFDYLEKISDEFVKEISTYASKINVEENSHDEKGNPLPWIKKLNKIAYTSANNNQKIANIVSEAFAKSPWGSVDIKNSTNSETSLELNPGYEHNRGFVNQFFAFKDKKFEVSGDVKVLMSKEPISSLDLRYLGEILQEICINQDKALVILAPSFSEEILNMLWKNKTENQQISEKLKVCLVDIATNSVKANDRFDDLAAFLDCEPYCGQCGSLRKYQEKLCLEGQKNYPYLGNCDGVVITEKNSVFNVKNLKENAKKRADWVIDEMKNIISEEESGSIYDKSEEIVNLRKRITNLSPNGSVFIKVGAITDQERKNLYYLIEDAVHACRSAIKFGIVPGLNYANIKALNAIKENFECADCNIDDENKSKHICNIIDILINVYKESSKFIIKNGNPKISDEFADDIIKGMEINNTVYDIKENSLYSLNQDNFKVYNSVETDIEVLRTSLSIIGLLLNSSNFICSSGYIIT